MKDPSAVLHSVCLDARSTIHSGVPGASKVKPSPRKLRHQIVLMSGTHLACGKTAFRAVIEFHENGSQILHRHINGFKVGGARRGLECFSRKAWFLSLRYHSRDVAKNMRDPEAGQVLSKIAPVRPDVTQSGGGAAFLRIEPPGIIGFFQKPVLKVIAMEKCGSPDIPLRDGMAGLLHQRIAAVIERDSSNDLRPFACSASSLACAAVAASGLSEITCLPCARAAEITG